MLQILMADHHIPHIDVSCHRTSHASEDDALDLVALNQHRGRQRSGDFAHTCQSQKHRLLMHQTHREPAWRLREMLMI